MNYSSDGKNLQHSGFNAFPAAPRAFSNCPAARPVIFVGIRFGTVP